jgi:PPP family 3-phenylpropionic acid transporter
MKRIWPFSTNVFFFAAVSASVPFFVLYYQDLGFTGAQIGLIAGLTPLINTISAPFWGGLADRTQSHRRVTGMLFLLTAGAFVIFPYFQSFGVVLFIVATMNFLIAPLISMIDTATMYMLGEQKEHYGRVRVGGTYGFGIMAFIAGGVVESYGLKIAFWLTAGLMLVAFFFSQKLSFGDPEQPIEEKVPLKVVFRDPRWLVFLTIAFTGGIGFSVGGAFFFPYMASIGSGESMMGLALAIGTLSEVPVLFFGDRLLKFLKPYSLFLLAAVITGVRLVMFGLNSSPSLVIPIQLLNGLTFAMMWMAGVAYADLHAPKHMKATVQGVFAAMIFGVGSALGGFIGGPLLEFAGGQGLFLYYGIAILVIIGGAALAGVHINRRSRGGSAPVP